MDEQPGGRGAAFVTELDARRRRADAWWAAVSGRRAARGTFPFSISFNRAYMESCPLFKGKQALTEEEAAWLGQGTCPPAPLSCDGARGPRRRRRVGFRAFCATG
eukprot:jgi/Mesvir1/2224/Mv04559-RA.1